MENFSGLNLSNVSMYQQNGILYNVPYDPNVIVGTYPHNLAFPPAGVWQGNAWVQGWGCYPNSGQLGYTAESIRASNRTWEYNTFEECQPYFLNDVNSSFTHDDVADHAIPGNRGSPPGNSIYIVK